MLGLRPRLSVSPMLPWLSTMAVLPFHTAMADSKNGWVKIHRDILKWEWYQDIPTKVLFIHIIITANHSRQNWRGKTIERGQKWTSLNSLANETGLSMKQVRTAMMKLEKTGELASERASEGTMLTICKYDDYQAVVPAEGQADRQTKGKEGASEGHTKGKGGATNNNENNEKTSRKEELEESFLGKNSNSKTPNSGDEVNLEHPPFASTAVAATDVQTSISHPALAAALLNYHACQRDRGRVVDAYTIKADIAKCLAMSPEDAIAAMDTAISGSFPTFLAKATISVAPSKDAPARVDLRSVDYAEGL